MPLFHEKQRVRIVPPAFPQFVGKEAVITCIPSQSPGPKMDCDVLLIGERSTHPTGEFSALFQWLAPLSDPKADEFIAEMNKWAPASNPSVEA